MSDDYFLGIDPDLQTPALAVVQGQEVVFVSCLRTGKSKRQEAVVELAKEAMHWMDGTCDHLCLAGYHYPLLRRIVVEAQEIYAGKTQNPQDILLLAAGAGAVLNASCCRWPNAEASFVLPKHWKGEVPKRIHQARILKRLGIPCEPTGTKDRGYCVPHWPEGREPIYGNDKTNKSDWKHIVDAIGLACYARDTA